MTQYVDLNVLIDWPNEFDFGRYWEGEQELIKPALQDKGYEVGSFWSVERDSFGPLIRGVSITKDNHTQCATYG